MLPEPSRCRVDSPGWKNGSGAAVSAPTPGCQSDQRCGPDAPLVGACSGHFQSQWPGGVRKRRNVGTSSTTGDIWRQWYPRQSRYSSATVRSSSHPGPARSQTSGSLRKGSPVGPQVNRSPTKMNPAHPRSHPRSGRHRHWSDDDRLPQRTLPQAVFRKPKTPAIPTCPLNEIIMVQ